MHTVDANYAAAHIAYALSDVSMIYPITPSSTMGELVDQWASEDRKNIYGNLLKVVEMQSEGGVAGSVHGCIGTGSLVSTFTASQGLLLMMPNMYKIAGELLPCVFHVSARAVAGQALSIFGDHSDVMGVRAAGWNYIASASAQESMDLALVAHLATLRASLPFVHFFDGFRSSHELSTIDFIDYADIAKLVDHDAIAAFRARALNPEHPVMRGTAQGPEIFMQAVEAANKYYNAVPEIVQEEMDRVSKLTGREYHLFDYHGAADATKVIVTIGSSANVIHETVDYLLKQGEKVGLIKCRLPRPFSVEHFVAAMPKTVQKVAVLDRTKEPGAVGEPLYLDVVAAMMSAYEGTMPKIVGGRYGLGSKAFTPAMVKGIYDYLENKPQHGFLVGIEDDVCHKSIPVGEEINVMPSDVKQCLFWGLGADGTVGANKNVMKLISEESDNYVQGYFAYDSKKSGGVTASHLRFGPRPITSHYEIVTADYVACHFAQYAKTFDLLSSLAKGGVFVLNTVWTDEELEHELPNAFKRELAEKNAKFYCINANAVAEKCGLGGRINNVMMTVFFKLVEIIPLETAVKALKAAVYKSYRLKGDDIVNNNYAAIDAALEGLREVPVKAEWASLKDDEATLGNENETYRKIIKPLAEQRGNSLPVSALPAGGEMPTATTQYERRCVASHVPKWAGECSQCNKCSLVCPHATIRPFLVTEEQAKAADLTVQKAKALGKNAPTDLFFRIQVDPFDCTGCGACVEVCPSHALSFQTIDEGLEAEAEHWDYCLTLPLRDDILAPSTVKGAMFQRPLLEFSGACAGCGETPYVKLLTQLFGSRMIIANATGCSSIWGGSFPVSPYAVDKDGKGPAWANSLFEDNAEYGAGFAVSVQTRRANLALDMDRVVADKLVSDELATAFAAWKEGMNVAEVAAIEAAKVKALLKDVKAETGTPLERILQNQDLLAKPSVWIVGGDGWAYDIGYGGLDHVLSMGLDLNILVMDTEVYSNTGGQCSKATQMGAVAKFSSSGKPGKKKDLGAIAMTYGNVFVASVAMGANTKQLIDSVSAAESYNGTSLIIAYAPCIAHGIKGGLRRAQNEEKLAVESGYWLLYSFDPRLAAAGKNPMKLTSKPAKIDVQEFLDNEARFAALKKTQPERAAELAAQLSKDLKARYHQYVALVAANEPQAE
ncbi:Pyruvate-flavodoxin oxidoreductase [Carpediemonas membranifera]|uniref:Pyruvate-flavodoxin oxidoreductase n=1 Tax=Carpediemonas membranifera TaxID=201153 RepID=A0A8J6BVU4_9EUKA|nr:Pyruvate-flavodoxin oxidoreductase [Carpediemonas membranifera]|eukprot:KAG9391761.1 Pyruvate-flavodoxin oxidoreductase [Carpediemonas membranifera]